MSGPETFLAPEVLLCLEGNPNAASNNYLSIWNGEALPGFTLSGASGGSVNHDTLAGFIAACKGHPKAIKWWDEVCDHWRENGLLFIEDGTRNEYWEWIVVPLMGMWSLHNHTGCRDLAKAAIAQASMCAWYGPTINSDGTQWRSDRTTTLCGARSWRFKDGYWRHQGREIIDTMLDWALWGDIQSVPSWSWAGKAIRTPLLTNPLTGAEARALNSMIAHDPDDGPMHWSSTVLRLLNACTVHVPITVWRNEGGVTTMRAKSCNGNTEFMYACTYVASEKQCYYLGHGNGGRPNKHQGKAWRDGDRVYCESNDGKQGPFSIKMAPGKLVYQFDCVPGGTYTIQTPAGQPVEPPQGEDPPQPDPTPTPEPSEPPQGDSGTPKPDVSPACCINLSKLYEAVAERNRLKVGNAVMQCAIHCPTRASVSGHLEAINSIMLASPAAWGAVDNRVKQLKEQTGCG